MAGGAVIGNPDEDGSLVITGGGDNGLGDGVGGNGGFSGDGAGGAGDGEGDDEGGEDFGPMLDQEQIRKVVSAEGVTLPSDMAECAKTFGIPAVLLERYMAFQVGRKRCPFRDAMMCISYGHYFGRPSFLEEVIIIGSDVR